jgi:tetratricopeptide (TPR) repeat protein
MKVAASFRTRLGTLSAIVALSGLSAILPPAEAAPKKPATANPPAKPAKPQAKKPAAPKAEVAKPEKPKPSNAPADEATRKEAQTIYDEALKSFQKGDLPAAKQGFQKVIDLVPGNAPALLNLASIEQRQREFAKSARHLREILREILRDDPENASAWLILGIGAYEQDKVDAAHAHLAQAVLYAPKNAQAHQFLGVVLGRKRWYSAGEEELRRAVDLDPRFADAHYNLAVLYLERVPPAVELSRRHYQRALELGAPPDPDLVKKLDTP